MKPFYWILGAILTALTCACAMQSGAESIDVQFQAAVQKEVVDGDLPGAIKLYETLARSSNRAMAAKALLRMARCYERSGDDRQARKVYERIVREFGDQQEAALAANLLKSSPGWYNGDWQSGIPGLANFYLSENKSRRVYDDFVVPEGGWTVTAVFSDNRMESSGIERAAWEIRSGMSPGHGGKKIASGLSRATQTPIPGNGPFPNDPLAGYRIEVDGLQVRLAPGRYWLSVAPVATGKSYISATKGRHAVGDPPGNNGGALFYGLGRSFAAAEALGARGQLGVGKDFSQGVIILEPK